MDKKKVEWEKEFEKFEITEASYKDVDAPDKVIVNAQAADYAEYQRVVIDRRVNELAYLIMRTIDTLDTRRSEHLSVIEELMRQNESLKAKLKEKNNA